MVNIRNFRDQDAPHLWQLFFHTIRHINRRDYTEAQVTAWAPEDIDPGYWLPRMQGLQPYVAEIDQTIVGYTDLQDDGLIDHFFCHHQYQGQGVGKALMQHVFAEASRRCINQLHSHVSITAQPFYSHMGFDTVEEQQMEARGQTLINFLMGKSVEETSSAT
jgi:putative acetyltransferase